MTKKKKAKPVKKEKVKVKTEDEKTLERQKARVEEYRSVNAKKEVI